MTGRVRRGDVFYADLRPTVGSEQDGVRPVLVVQNDTANRLSPTVVVCALTSQLKRTYLPTHVLVPQVSRSGASVALVEQLRTLDKRRLLRRIGRASPEIMARVDAALAFALALAAPGVPLAPAARSADAGGVAATERENGPGPRHAGDGGTA